MLCSVFMLTATIFCLLFTSLNVMSGLLCQAFCHRARCCSSTEEPILFLQVSLSLEKFSWKPCSAAWTPESLVLRWPLSLVRASHGDLWNEAKHLFHDDTLGPTELPG